MNVMGINLCIMKGFHLPYRCCGKMKADLLESELVINDARFLIDEKIFSYLDRQLNQTERRRLHGSSKVRIDCPNSDRSFDQRFT